MSTTDERLVLPPTQDCLSDALKPCYTDGQIVCLQPPGRFTKKASFIAAYQRAVAAGQIVHLAEIVENEGPIRVDVDLSRTIAPNNGGVNLQDPLLYTLDQLKRVVQCVQAACKEMLNFWHNGSRLPVADENLTCIVLQKPAYMKEDRLKNGFHLHLPFCIADTSVIKSHILPFTNYLLTMDDPQNACFPDTPQPVDLQAASNPWLLYGSSKPSGQPYKVTHIWTVDFDTVDPLAFAQQCRIIWNGCLVDVQLPNDWPLVLSISVKDRSDFYKHVLKQAEIVTDFWQKNRNQHRHVDEPRPLAKHEVDRLIERFRPYLELIDKDRQGYHNVVTSVGRALYAETGGATDAFFVWKNWAQVADDEAFRDWEDFRGTKANAGIIFAQARHCAPDKYKELKQAQYGDYIKRMLNGNDKEIAELECNLLGDSFVCTDDQTGDGYLYRAPLWVQKRKNFIASRFLKADVPETVPYLVNLFYKDCLDQLTELGGGRGEEGEDEEDEEDEDYEDGEEEGRRKRRGRKRRHTNTTDAAAANEDVSKKVKLEMYVEKCGRVQKKIANMTGITNVARAVHIMMLDEKFAESLDAAAHLIAFKNGVFNLHSHEFYPGLPSDRLSRQLNATYNVKACETDEDVLFVRQFFAQLFPDEEIREYAMGCYAMALYGSNVEKIVVFCTGIGNNGKSVLARVMSSLFGQLAFSMNVANFHTDYSNAQSATPELFRLRGKRLVYVPEVTGVIKTGLLRRITGSDELTARDLNKTPISFRPQCQLHFYSNSMPPIHGLEKAVENRVRVLKFESEFIDLAEWEALRPEDRDKKFVKDHDVDKKLSLDALAFVLLDTFKRCFGNRITPRKVVLDSKEYCSENNIYLTFFDKCMKRVPMVDTRLDEAFEAFLVFITANMPQMDKKELTKSAFKAGMTNVLKGPPEISDNNVLFWPNLSLVTPAAAAATNRFDFSSMATSVAMRIEK